VADGDGGSIRPRSGMESNLLRQVNAAGISIHAKGTAHRSSPVDIPRALPQCLHAVVAQKTADDQFQFLYNPL
jgi:hypothetical protein